MSHLFCQMVFSLVIHSVLIQYRFVSQSYIACCFSVGLCFQFSHACSQFILIHFSYGFLILKFFKVSLPKLTLYPPLLWYPQVSHAASSCHTNKPFMATCTLALRCSPSALTLVGLSHLSDSLVHASVNSLTAVIGPWAVRPACTAFMPFRLLNLKLCELIIACGTLSHNTLSACISRLLYLTTWYKHPRDRTVANVSQFQLCVSATHMQLDPCEQVSLIPRPMQVRSEYEANYNERYNT